MNFIHQSCRQSQQNTQLFWSAIIFCSACAKREPRQKADTLQPVSPSHEWDGMSCALLVFWSMAFPELLWGAKWKREQLFWATSLYQETLHSEKLVGITWIRRDSNRQLTYPALFKHLFPMKWGTGKRAKPCFFFSHWRTIVWWLSSELHNKEECLAQNPNKVLG